MSLPWAEEYWLVSPPPARLSSGRIQAHSMVGPGLSLPEICAPTLMPLLGSGEGVLAPAAPTWARNKPVTVDIATKTAPALAQGAFAFIGVSFCWPMSGERAPARTASALSTLCAGLLPAGASEVAPRQGLNGRGGQ